MKKLLALLLTACIGYQSSTADLLFPVPPQYYYWHQELEKCSGLSQSFHSIKFFIGDVVQVDGMEFDGLWEPKENLIILRRARMLDKLSVLHELMHSLAKTTGHPFKYFNLVCGELNPPGRNRVSAYHSD